MSQEISKISNTTSGSLREILGPTIKHFEQSDLESRELKKKDAELANDAEKYRLFQAEQLIAEYLRIEAAS